MVIKISPYPNMVESCYFKKMNDSIPRECPLCQKKGLKKRIRHFQINMQETIQLCENTQCNYPMGTMSTENILKERDIAKKATVHSISRPTSIPQMIKIVKPSPGRSVTTPVRILKPFGIRPTIAASTVFKPYGRIQHQNSSPNRHGKHATRQLADQSLGSLESILIIICHNATLCHYIESSKHSSVLKSLVPIAKESGIKLSVSSGWGHKSLQELYIWLLSQDKSVYKQCVVEYSALFQCDECSHKDTIRNSGPVVSIPTQSEIMSLSNLSYTKKCPKCQSQVTCYINLDRLPDTFLVHYQKGIRDVTMGDVSSTVCQHDYAVTTAVTKGSDDGCFSSVWCLDSDGVWKKYTGLDTYTCHQQIQVGKMSDVCLIWEKKQCPVSSGTQAMFGSKETGKKISTYVPKVNNEHVAKKVVWSTRPETPSAPTSVHSSPASSSCLQASLLSPIVDESYITKALEINISSSKKPPASIMRARETFKMCTDMNRPKHIGLLQERSPSTLRSKFIAQKVGLKDTRLGGSSDYVNTVTQLLKTNCESPIVKHQGSQLFEGYKSKSVSGSVSSCSSRSSSPGDSSLACMTTLKGKRSQISPQKTVKFAKQTVYSPLWADTLKKRLIREEDLVSNKKAKVHTEVSTCCNTEPIITSSPSAIIEDNESSNDLLEEREDEVLTNLYKVLGIDETPVVSGDLNRSQSLDLFESGKDSTSKCNNNEYDSFDLESLFA